MSTTQDTNDTNGGEQLYDTTNVGPSEEQAERAVSRRAILGAMGAGGAAVAVGSASAIPGGDAWGDGLFPTNPDEYDGSVYSDCSDIRGGDLGLAAVSGYQTTLNYSAWAEVDRCWEDAAQKATRDLDYYSNALDLKQKTTEEAMVEAHNNLAGIENSAVEAAKIAFATAYLNGKGMSECHGEAVTAVQNKLSTIQKNTLTAWHTAAIAINRLRQQTAENNDIDPKSRNTDPLFNAVMYDRDNEEYVNVLEDASESGITYTEGTSNFTLLSGEDVDYRQLQINGDGENIYHSKSTETEGATYGEAHQFGPTEYDKKRYSHGVAVTRPNETEMREVVRAWEFADIIEEAEAAYDVVMDRLGTDSAGYLNDVYQHLENGVISIAGPAEGSFLTASEWSQMSLDDSDIGTRSWFDAQMASLGVGGLTKQTSATLTVHSGSTVDGAELDSEFVVEGNIYSKSVPPTTGEDGEASWQTGTTYQTSNFTSEDDSPPVVIGHYTTDSEGEDVYQRMTVEGEFTLNELRNTDTGENVDSAGHTDNTQETADSTQYEEDMEELKAEIEALNDLAENDAGIDSSDYGGGNITLFGDDGLPQWLLLIPGVGLVVLVILIFLKLAGD